MNKKREKILALILTWAGLFMIILYSPIGSPDLYTKQKYLVGNRSAILYNVEEENMPSMTKNTSRSLFSDESQSTPFPTSESEINRSAYAVTSSQQLKSKQMTETNAVFNQHEISQNRGRGYMMANGYVGSISIKRNSKKNSLTDNDITSIIADLTTLDNTIKNRQGIGYNPNSGATSPGEDPIGDPIPFGDGWLYMLFLAIGYTAWKVYKLKSL
jgi:hypothetical protein